MKKILALSMAILATTTVTEAQQSKMLSQPKSKPYLQLMHTLLHTADNGLAEKTTMLKQRVIAQSTWDKTGATPVLTDTAAFGYTGNTRGSAYNYNMMAYYFNYPSSAFLNYTYLSSSPYRQDVKADSLHHWLDDGNGLTLHNKQYCTYNGAGQQADFISYDYSYNPADGERYIHTYDAQGRLTMRLNLVDNAGDWDTSSREFFRYNAQNKLLLDSVEEYNGVNVWAQYARYVFIYDAFGNATRISFSLNLGSGTLTTVVRYDNTFNYNNTLRTSRLNLYQGSAGLAPYYEDSFGYTTGIDYYTYMKEKDYDVNTASWQPYYQETRHINSQNLPDTVFVSLWSGNAWAPENKTAYTYNSYNNPAAFVTYGLPAGTVDNVGTYYYETYNDPTAVTNMPFIAPDIKLYPNPTGGNLSISWANAIAGTPVTISITGMSGQIVYSETLRWSRATEQLSVGHLQPGMYQLIIRDERGASLFHQSIVKQ